MPTLLPEKVRRQTKQGPERPAARSIDWLGVGVLSIAEVTIVSAAVVYAVSADNVVTAFVLFAGAAIVTLLAHGDGGSFDE